MASSQEVINPIYPEYLPRLTKEFIELYNDKAANRIAGHQVPIEEVFLIALIGIEVTIVSRASMEISVCIRHRSCSRGRSKDRLYCSRSSWGKYSSTGI